MGNVTYDINEIFRSLQCEGYNAGRPAVFLRFAGCQLHCSYCDTDHSLMYKLTLQELTSEIVKLEKVNLIYVLTGGEPTLQNLTPLIEFIGEERVCIETNGVLWKRLHKIRERFPDVFITVSPKAGHISYKSFEVANEIKVVLDKNLDMKKIECDIPYSLFNSHRCYIQPCSEDYQPAIDYVSENPLWRLSVQLQKVLNIR